MTRKKTILLFLVILIASPCVASAQITRDGSATNKPNVLLVGDSISLAYTPLVQKAFEDSVVIERVKGNCRFSAYGKEHAATWVGDKHWNVIHFNFGLWDLYGWKQDKLISVEDYGQNLEAIVEILKPACDILIFATTTPPCSEPEHNIQVLASAEKAAAFEVEARRVMKKHGVLVNDLDGILAGRMKQLGKAPNDVHYSPAGNKVIAEKVASFIDMSLGLLPKKQVEIERNDQATLQTNEHN